MRLRLAGFRSLRSLHEPLRSHRARKCSRTLARRASSKPQSSKMLALRAQMEPPGSLLGSRKPLKSIRGSSFSALSLKLEPTQLAQLPRSLQEAPKEAPRGSQGLTQLPNKPPRDSTRGSTRLPRGAQWLSGDPQSDQEASKRFPQGHKKLKRSSKTPPGGPKANVKLEEAVEAAVEDASKLFRSRWPRSGLAGSDFARSRSATTRGQ